MPQPDPGAGLDDVRRVTALEVRDGPVAGEVEAERLAQPGRAVGEVAVGRARSTLPSEVEPVDHLAGPEEDGTRHADRPGDEPWSGTARFEPLAGTRRGEPRSLDHPYGTCVATSTGYVLVAGNAGPRGLYPAVAWLDATGRVVRQREEREVDGRTTVSDAGTVVLPMPSGFDLVTASGRTHHLRADDAWVTSDGSVWTVRGTRVRRSAP